jgi:antibiotic biosynthesis monooxygenase (ABM) superfamily enzyme
VAPLIFRLFIRSIEYPYEKSNCDYAKLTNEILNLLVEKFPGYDDSNIVRFRNAKNELIEAEVAHR